MKRSFLKKIIKKSRWLFLCWSWRYCTCIPDTFPVFFSQTFTFVYSFIYYYFIFFTKTRHLFFNYYYFETYLVYHHCKLYLKLEIKMNCNLGIPKLLLLFFFPLFLHLNLWHLVDVLIQSVLYPSGWGWRARLWPLGVAGVWTHDLTISSTTS